MFENAAACCVNVFNYKNCTIEDICLSVVVPVHAPSKIPTCAEETNKKRCTKASLCSWDTSRSICVLQVAPFPTPKTSPNTHLLAMEQQAAVFSTLKPSSNPTIEATSSQCKGMSKKQCTKDADCDWNTDQGCVTATSMSNCRQKNKWHPLTASDRICTNSDAYPALWVTSAYSSHYLSNSAKECCQRFYSDGACQMVDVCS